MGVLPLPLVSHVTSGSHPCFLYLLCLCFFICEKEKMGTQMRVLRELSPLTYPKCSGQCLAINRTDIKSFGIITLIIVLLLLVREERY